MRGVKDFLRDSLPAMVDYILIVSSPTKDAYGSIPGAVADRHDRLNVVNSLRQRALTMSVLDRESIPILPHLLDIPRHLAIITSAVIRNSRDFHAKTTGPRDPADKYLDDFCSKCFEVEEHALLRVSQLATRISSDRRRTSASANWSQKSSPPASVATSPADRTPSSPLSIPSNGRRRPRKSSRPSTAPSASESDTSRRQMLSDGPPRMFTRTSTDTLGSAERTRIKPRLPHLKSPSTDSVPVFGVTAKSNSTSQPSASTDPLTDISDDAGKRKKGLLRGILRRNNLQ